MAPRKKDENGEDKDVGKSVYLVKVNSDDLTAEVSRLPVGVKNENGETYYLVRDKAVKALSTEAYSGNSRLVKTLVAQNIRAQLKATSEFETATIDLNIDNMDRNKAKAAKESDDVDLEDEDLDEDKDEVAQPATESEFNPGRF